MDSSHFISLPECASPDDPTLSYARICQVDVECDPVSTIFDDQRSEQSCQNPNFSTPPIMCTMPILDACHLSALVSVFVCNTIGGRTVSFGFLGSTIPKANTWGNV